MSFEADLKNQLDVIIDKTYKDDKSYKDSYKWFKLKIILDKDNSNSKIAENKIINYNSEAHTITIYQTSKLSHSSMFIRLIHEVSEHIRKRQYPAAGAHGPEFWMIYKNLLYASFDLCAIAPDTILFSTPITGMNKIEKMVETYTKRPISNSTIVRICLFKCPYNKKDEIKEKGYKWNPLAGLWYKEIPENESKEEKEHAKIIDKAINAYCYDSKKLHLLSKN